MANNYTDVAYALAKASPSQVEPRDLSGKVRASTFTLNLASTYAEALDGTLDTQISSGDVVYLCRIPAGVRITRVSFHTTVGLGGTATIAVGIAGADGSGNYDGTTPNNSGFFRAAAIYNTANSEITGFTVAGSKNYVTLKDVWVTMTVAAADLPSSGVIYGVIEYVGA